MCDTLLEGLRMFSVKRMAAIPDLVSFPALLSDSA